MAIFSRVRKYTPLLTYCFVASLAATAFGFDQGCVNGFLAMQAWLKDFGGGAYDPSTGQWGVTAGRTSLVNGITIGFSILSAISSGWIGTHFGRKIGLFLTAVVSLIGSILQMAPTLPTLILGKVFMGCAIGFTANFTITYWSETAPPQLRGMMVILYQLMINIPNVIAACVDQATHRIPDPWAYRIPLFVTILPPILLIVFVWFIPESPRWLVTHERYDDAKNALRKIRGRSATEQELDTELEEVKAFTELEKQLETSTTYLECFKGTDLRRTLVSILVISAQQPMGIGFIAAYSTYFFSLIGLQNPFVGNVIVNSVGVGGCIFAFCTVRFLGRRPMLIWGAGINSFCMLAYAAVAQADPSSTAAKTCVIALICIYSFTFAATWGSVGPVVGGEVPSNRLRSKTVSIAYSALWCWCLAVVVGVPYLINPDYANIGTQVGFIFGSLGIVIFILTIILVPETKDRRLEEIDEMFLNRVPTRKFKTYVCSGQAGGYDVLHRETKHDNTIIEAEEKSVA